MANTGPYKQEWRTVKVGDLHEDPANARKHPDRNRQVVRSSLKEFGQVEALVVQMGTGRVLGGSCRLVELRAMGVEEVQVCEVDVHGVDATRLALTLNRSAELAEWGDDLADILQSLGAEDAIEGLGWSDDEIRNMMGDIVGDASATSTAGAPDQSNMLQDQFRILVECETEHEQLAMLERFEEEGIKCRAYML